MRALVAALVIVLTATGCADESTESGREVAVRPPADTQAWIHVEVVQTACCYVEGSTDVLEITDRNGFRMAELAFATKEPLGDDQFLGRFEPVPVELGPQTVMVWQEDCGGGCSWVEGGDNSFLIESAEGPHRRDLCAITLEMTPGDVFVEARWSPFDGCESIEVLER